MKATTFLLIVITMMHFTTLINITLFDGEWNGIVMAINTFLFILALALVLSLKNKNKN